MRTYEPLDMDTINRWDEESFHLLFRMYYKALVGYAQSIVSSADDAEDVVQDLMAFMAGHAPSFDSRQSLERYLFVSVRNRSINHLRQRHAEESPDAVPPLASDDAGDDEWLLMEQLYQRLFATIDLLPPRSREVLLLVAQGKGNKEIAEALGMSVQTVKTHKKRAMAFLRGRMGGRVSDDTLLSLSLAILVPMCGLGGTAATL